MLISKAITAKITQIVWEHMHTLSFPAKVIYAVFTSSIFSKHSTNLSSKLFCTYNVYCLNTH